jgi:hypothetical protein
MKAEASRIPPKKTLIVLPILSPLEIKKIGIKFNKDYTRKIFILQRML